MQAALMADSAERSSALPGDELVPDAKIQTTRGITINASPAVIWPLLVQMVEREAPPAPSVCRAVQSERALICAALYDHAARQYLSFDDPRPACFWCASWALVLEPLHEHTTRLHVRSRVAFTADAVRRCAQWMHPFHDFMDLTEFRRLRARAESHRGGSFIRLARRVAYLVAPLRARATPGS